MISGRQVSRCGRNRPPGATCLCRGEKRIRGPSGCFLRRHKRAYVVVEDHNERRDNFLPKSTVEKIGPDTLAQGAYLTYRPFVTVRASMFPSVLPTVTRLEFSGERSVHVGF